MIERILQELGSLADVARACGVKKGTPWAWKQRGYIPACYWADLIRLGAERGVEVPLSVLVDAASRAGGRSRQNSACDRKAA